MSTDEKDQAPPPEKEKPSPRQVVITHYGKKRKSDPTEVPPEIAPASTAYVVSSPIDPHAAQGPKLPPIPEPAEEPPSTSPAWAAIEEEPEEREARGEGVVPPQAPPPPSNPVAVRGNAFIPGAALFLSVVAASAVVALAFYSYLSQQEFMQLQTQVQEDKSVMQTFLQESKKSLAQLDELQQTASAEQKILNTLKAQLEGTQAHLGELLGSQEWRLTQANYLVFMANERLHTSGDIPTALKQLEEADQRLAGLHNPAWTPLRSALAKDIAKLRSFPTINRQVLWEQMILLSGNLNELSFKALTLPEKVSASTLSADWPKWRKALWHSWQELKGIIRVSNLEKNPIPQGLNEQEQMQILRTLQLMCSQLQWAILQGNSQVYASNLHTIELWVKEYFLEDHIQKKVLDHINQLLKERVEIETPDISGSVQGFAKAMAELTRKGE